MASVTYRGKYFAQNLRENRFDFHNVSYVCFWAQGRGSYPKFKTARLAVEAVEECCILRAVVSEGILSRQTEAD